MKAVVFVTVTKSGAVKMTKEKPSLAPHQRAVRLTISIPDAAFLDPPILDAQLDIPEGLVAYPAITGAVDVELWS